MSCHIVTNNHIHAIVEGFADSNVGGRPSIERLTQVGQMLLDQNYASYNARYGEKLTPCKYTYKEVKLLKPIEIIKLCQSLDYQSCETEDYKKSDARDFIVDLIDALVMKLDGYDEARWVIDDD